MDIHEDMIEAAAQDLQTREHLAGPWYEVFGGVAAGLSPRPGPTVAAVDGPKLARYIASLSPDVVVELFARLRAARAEAARAPTHEELVALYAMVMGAEHPMPQAVAYLERVLPK